MKKVLLMGISLIALASNAQVKSVHPKLDESKKNISFRSLKNPSFNVSKESRAISRWYDPLISSLIAANGDTTGLDNNTSSTFLWQDTTMLVRYSTAGGGSSLGGIYLKSMGQVLDPFAARFNGIHPNNNGKLALQKTDSYTLDSVSVAGFYRRLASKPNIVDSLIFTVGFRTPTGGVNYLLAGSNGASTLSCYGIDTMRISALTYNFAKMGISGTNTIRKAIPLTIADSGSNYFSTAVNLNVPAGGNLVTFSVDFKSGDTWTPNVDTVGNFNFFRAYSTEETFNTLQKYYKNDWNSTHTKDGDSTGWGDDYVPNYFYIGAANSCITSFDREQYWTLFKITSNGTSFVSINDIKSQVAVSVSPNPASSNVIFDLNFANSFKSTTIQLTNSIGQVVKTIQLGNVSANTSKGYLMNVSDLAKGLYIYTITADGQSQSGKLSVN